MKLIDNRPVNPIIVNPIVFSEKILVRNNFGESFKKKQ